MSKDYALEFDLSPYHSLDKFALLADQNYNLGDKDDWFGCFRGGLYGLYARLTGVQIHFKAVHSWDFSLKTQLAEYHLSSIFFNMDSAIECLVFALNALGYIADSSLFHDIADENGLKAVSPYDILVNPQKKPTKFIKGYDVYFPFLKKYWLDNRHLLSLIFDQHDVSKHRSTIFVGGNPRDDPPYGFFETLGIEGDTAKQMVRALFTPMAEILILPEVKRPLRQRKKQDYKDVPKLESIAEEFCKFINDSGAKILEDAKTNIKLNCYEFLREDKEI